MLHWTDKGICTTKPTHTCRQMIRCASTPVVIRDFWWGVVDLYPGVRFQRAQGLVAPRNDLVAFIYAAHDFDVCNTHDARRDRHELRMAASDDKNSLNLGVFRVRGRGIGW